MSGTDGPTEGMDTENSHISVEGVIKAVLNQGNRANKDGSTNLLDPRNT